MRFAGNTGIQQQQIEPADCNFLVQRTGWKCVGASGKRRTHHVAGIVIAGNAGKRQFQRRQQALEVLVFFRRRRIREVARNHHKIGRGCEFVQGGHAALERVRGVDAAVSQRAGRFDMQIGDLRNANGF